MSLTHFLELWDLSDPHRVAITPIAEVYRVRTGGQLAALKLFTDLGQKDESGSVAAHREFAGRSFAQLLKSDSGAQLLEWLDGPSFFERVRDLDLEARLREFSSIFNGLHSPSPQAVGLIELKKRLSALLDHPVPPKMMEAQVLALELLRTTVGPAPLHGDLHGENLLFCSRRKSWIAIDPKGLYGDRTYDAVVMLSNWKKERGNMEMSEQELEMAALVLNLKTERLKKWIRVYEAVSELWSIEDRVLQGSATLPNQRL